jgi:hypothetical protein
MTYIRVLFDSRLIFIITISIMGSLRIYKIRNLQPLHHREDYKLSQSN